MDSVELLSGLATVRERICELEVRSTETFPDEQQREKRKACVCWGRERNSGTISKGNCHTCEWDARARENGEGEIFE
jgi:hypothetical protein